MFAQGHVGEVEQPAGTKVVGKLLEVFGEVVDRQAGPGGVGVHGGRRDRQDARALAPAHDAVFVLAPAKRGHALEVDDGEQELLRHAIVALDERPRLAQHFIAPVRLALGIEQERLRHQHRGDLATVPGTPGGFQRTLEPRDQLVTGLLPRFTDLLQRRRRAPRARARQG